MNTTRESFSRNRNYKHAALAFSGFNSTATEEYDGA
jgi:hypothetical protein